jgi:hypothetical protein
MTDVEAVFDKQLPDQLAPFQPDLRKEQEVTSGHPGEIGDRVFAVIRQYAGKAPWQFP